MAVPRPASTTGDPAVDAVLGELLAALVKRLARRMEFDLSVAERSLYVTLGDETLSGAIVLRQLTNQPLR